MANEWTLTTEYDIILADRAIIGDGLPTFTPGEEAELELLFNRGTHTDEYYALMNFVEYINDNTLGYGTDSNGKPWFRQTPHPADTEPDKLVLLDGEVDGVDSYWAIVTDYTDNTQFVGAGERVSVTFFILAREDEYASRTDIQTDLEAEA